MFLMERKEGHLLKGSGSLSLLLDLSRGGAGFLFLNYFPAALFPGYLVCEMLHQVLWALVSLTPSDLSLVSAVWSGVKFRQGHASSPVKCLAAREDQLEITAHVQC